MDGDPPLSTEQLFSHLESHDAHFPVPASAEPSYEDLFHEPPATVEASS
ncbi:hypothetical protein LV78_003899 [Actinosynnema pretiosum]|nr:hypothetical protein [Actinosynnema pretiosum]